MDNFITTAKNDKIVSGDDEFYTNTGQEDFLDENNNPITKENNDTVFAKKIFRDNGSYRLMIKCDSSSRPVDPNNQLGNQKDSYSSAYRQDSKFIMVNQKAFDYYISFLKTGVHKCSITNQILYKIK